MNSKPFDGSKAPNHKTSKPLREISARSESEM